MENKISVLIVDDDALFCNLLKDCLHQEIDMEVSGIAKDGHEAIEMVHALSPDVVILDILLPGLGGIEVLKSLSDIHENKRPLFIVTTSFGQEIFIKNAIEAGAHYYMIKPFDIENLVFRIKQLHKEKSEQMLYKIKYLPQDISIDTLNRELTAELEKRIDDLLRKIGIPDYMEGHQYAKEAIFQATCNPKGFFHVAKVLYPSVMEKFNSSYQTVDREIRYAIRYAWLYGNPGLFDRLFGCTGKYKKKSPTSSVFIALMADKVRIDMKKGHSL